MPNETPRERFEAEKGKKCGNSLRYTTEYTEWLESELSRPMEEDESEKHHCTDCCCAQSWKALGVTEYDGKSIPEHIAELSVRLAEAEKRVRIICSAVWYKNDLKYEHQPKNIESGFVAAGRRHHNCFITLLACFGKENKPEMVQGFITSDDRFVDRKEAHRIALAANQILNPEVCRDETIGLISEDLY